MDDAWASVALPGTYKMVVYSPDRVVLSTKDFTYNGAKLVLEEAMISKWTWKWSWPVCEFFPKEMSVTVSNKGDLPTFASVSLVLDNKNIGLVDLGYVDSGAVRTFTFPSPYYMIAINYKNPGDTIPPSLHAFAVYLVSKIPQSASDKESWYGPAPSALSAYYNSPNCPYKSFSGKPGYLLLSEYSTTAQTPQVKTSNP
ncbi:MAG: hypothetical protein PHR43_04505 [Dehalococcoidales bacterium]|nr:hypothetical protein [Dehalococcoidales bacterium]